MKTKLRLLAFMTSALFLGITSNAQIGNGFEGPTGITFDGGVCRYYDADNITVHEIENYNAPCGTIVVKEVSSGTTLGYSIVLDPTTGNGPLGFSDGDAFGVASATFLSSEGGFVAPEGSQAFFMEDTDGTVTMSFDLVDLAGTTNPQFSMQYQLEDTGYEAEDFLRITIKFTGCTDAPITLIDTEGLDIDDLGIEDSWITLSADLTSNIGCKAELVIEFSSNSAAEELAIDAISFSAGTTLSTPNFDLNNSVSVYPNPSNGFVTIKNSGVILESATVTDINGRVIKSYDLNGTTSDKELNLSSVLSSGMYFMTISSKTASTVKKIIIN
nr:T9SS type A sorting domain-containing protein [uncultured Psychroserpens sp.]